jgi:hypothetical protein
LFITASGGQESVKSAADQQCELFMGKRITILMDAVSVRTAVPMRVASGFYSMMTAFLSLFAAAWLIARTENDGRHRIISRVANHSLTYALVAFTLNVARVKHGRKGVIERGTRSMLHA